MSVEKKKIYERMEQANSFVANMTEDEKNAFVFYSVACSDKILDWWGKIKNDNILIESVNDSIVNGVMSEEEYKMLKAKVEEN